MAEKILSRAISLKVFKILILDSEHKCSCVRKFYTDTLMEEYIDYAPLLFFKLQFICLYEAISLKLLRVFNPILTYLYSCIFVSGSAGFRHIGGFMVLYNINSFQMFVLSVIYALVYVNTRVFFIYTFDSDSFKCNFYVNSSQRFFYIHVYIYIFLHIKIHDVL